MLNARWQYRNVDATGIPVTGNIMPVRAAQSKGPRALVAEDVAFLAEAAAQRRDDLLVGGTRGGFFDRTAPYYRWLPPVGLDPYVHPLEERMKACRPDLALDRAPRCVLPEIARYFSSRVYTDPSEPPVSLYARFVDPQSVGVVHDRVLDKGVYWGRPAGGPGTRDWRSVEDALLKELNLDNAAFATALSSPDPARALDLRRIMESFEDVRRLTRVVVPCAVTTSVSCEWQESGYDQDPSTGSTGRVGLKLVPYALEGADFSFDVRSCFCTVPADGESTHSMFMDDFSVYYYSGDDRTPVSTCCADWVRVRSTGSLSLEPRCLRRDMLVPRRLYMIYRCWHRYGEYTEEDSSTFRSAMYLVSKGLSKWEADGDLVSEPKCRGLLEKAGLPSSIGHPVVDPYDEGEVAKHTAAIGVDLVAAFVLADLDTADGRIDASCDGLGWRLRG